MSADFIKSEESSKEHEERPKEHEESPSLTYEFENFIKQLCVTKQLQIKNLLEEKNVTFENLEQIYNSIKCDGLTANDFYKFTMGPVLFEFKCLNTFTVDIRDLNSQNKMQEINSEIIKRIISKLEELKDRKINMEDVLAICANNPKLLAFYEKQGPKLFEHPLVSEIFVDKRPNEEDDEELEGQFKTYVYIYFGFDSKSGKNRWIIQSRGLCAKNSYVETALMQLVYQSFMESYCEENKITKEQYIAKCIVQEIITIMGSNKEKECKYALFAGRRSCFSEFLILQNYIFFKLMDHEKIIGSSSMWSILSLRKMSFDIPYPWVGTIAHEMFMMAQAVYKDNDDNEDNLSLSQAIVLYIYKVLVHKEGTPFPCLPDTLGTETCFRALANVFSQDECILKVVDILRKDSGKMEDFKRKCSNFSQIKKTVILMDSDIGSFDELKKTQNAGTKMAAGGGFLGEVILSEGMIMCECSDKKCDLTKIIKNLSKNPELKMAVKVTSVKCGRETRYPVKEGDKEGDKPGKESSEPTLTTEQLDIVMLGIKRFRDSNGKPVKKQYNISHTFDSTDQMQIVLTERK